MLHPDIYFLFDSSNCSLSYYFPNPHIFKINKNQIPCINHLMNHRNKGIAILLRGIARRQVASTAMNSASSRSHAIFRIRIQITVIISLIAPEALLHSIILSLSRDLDRGTSTPNSRPRVSNTTKLIFLQLHGCIYGYPTHLLSCISDESSEVLTNKTLSSAADL